MENTIIVPGDHLRLELRPTFTFVEDNVDEPEELQYGDLPREVQEEVLNFFYSDNFRKDQTEDYVLENITSGSNSLCQGLSGVVDDVYCEIEDEYLLVVTVNLTVVKTPYSYFVEHYRIKTPKRCDKPITLKDFAFNVQEGYHKASNDGPITHDGDWKYLGDMNGNYMINITAGMTQTFLA